MAKRMYIAVFSGIIITSFIFLLITPNIPRGTLLKNVSWDLAEGDKFYYGLFDDYYRYQDTTPTLHYGALLKSEILEMEDYAGDRDFNDDLLITSSVLVGDERAGYEMPIYFDLYHILSLLYDLSGLYEGWSISDPANIYYADPSAFHVVYSEIYTAISNYLESAPNIENLDLGLSELPYFTDLSLIIQLLSTFVDVDTADFRFNSDDIGSIPDWWNWTSTDKSNNIAAIKAITDKTFDRVLAMTQNPSHTDTNKIQFDVLPYIYSSLPSYYSLDESTIYENWFNMSKVSFYYQSDYAATSEVEFKYVYPFDLFMFDTDISDYREFEGENGIMVKLVGDELFVQLGEYQWDAGSGTYKTAAMTGFPAGTWVSIATLSSDLRRDIPLKYTFSLGSNTFNINIFDIYSNEEQLVYSIPFTMEFPIPNDRVQASEDYIFYPFNFHVLEIVQNCGTTAEFYLDNVAFDLSNIIALDDESVVLDYAELAVESELNLVMMSIYHLIIFPVEFNVSEIRYIFDLLNYIYQLISQWLNISPPYLFQITDTPTELIIDLTPQTIYGIFHILGFDLNNVHGETLTSFQMRFDKIGRCFREAVISTDYIELGYIREMGIRLVSTTRAGDNYPSELPSEYSLLKNLEFSDAEVNSLIRQMDLASFLGYMWENYAGEVLALFGIIIGLSAFVGLGLTEIVRAIRRRTEM